MTKDVLVSISGLQTTANEMERNEDEPIEVFREGTYYFKDGKHYIFFEEMEEGNLGVTKTQIRIQGDETLEVIKKGISNMHLVLTQGKTNDCYYRTPFGELKLETATDRLFIDKQEERIYVQAEYGLIMDDNRLADNLVTINIKPRV